MDETVEKWLELVITALQHMFNECGRSIKGHMLYNKTRIIDSGECQREIDELESFRTLINVLSPQLTKANVIKTMDVPERRNVTYMTGRDIKLVELAEEM